MKKMLMFMLIGIFILTIFIGNVKALEFDNVKSYNPTTKEVTVKNAFGMGGDIAKVKLNSPLINHVPLGYQKVAEFTITSYEDYTNALKDLEFYDKKAGMNKIVRTFDFKARSTEDYQEDVYTLSCQDKITTNGTAIKECNQIKTGTVTKTREIWNKLTPADLKKNDVLIVGIFTDVKNGDYIEWIPNFFGVRIDEWAVWTADLNVGLIEYYQFNETSGTNAVEAVYKLNNITHTEAIPSSSGKIGYGISLSNGQTGSISASNSGLNGDVAKSFCFWAKPSGTGRYVFAIGTVDVIYLGGDNHIYLGEGVTDTGGTVSSGVWSHICYTYNPTGTAIKFYKDGANYFNLTQSMNRADTTIKVGSKNDRATATSYSGIIDEFGIWNRTLTPAEITQIYNGGTGITYTNSFTTPPTVTINSPVSANFTTSPQTVNFNCSALDNLEIKNVTLWINSAANYTQAGSGTNSTQLYRSLSLNEGIYNFYCSAIDNEGTTGTSETRQIRIDATAPVVNILYPTVNELQTFNDYINVTFNVSVSDNIGLNNCWYFNGTANNSITCGNNATIPLSSGSYNLAYYANDTLGNIGFNSTTILINKLIPTLNFTSSIIEGENTTIYFNLTAANISQANATLSYNGSNYQMFIASSNSTNAAFYRIVTAPLVTADSNVNLNVSYFINGVSYSTSTYPQLVYNIPNLTVSTSCSPAALTFNLVDEETLASIYGEFEYNFYYGLSNSSLVRTFGKITNSNTFSVCINNTISPTWTLGSGEIFYRNTTSYVDRRYYLFSGSTLTNASTNTINLHDLKTTSQTSFKLEVESTSLTPYENIFTTLVRWYPDLNQYRVVDMGKTDETGSTVIHVRTEDVDYRIGVYEQNGSLIKLADPIRMVCLVSPCTYTLKISPGETDYTSFLNIQYSLTYNETTRIWTFTYSDPAQKTSTMNLTVYKLTGTSDYVVCSNTVTGASGAITCNTSIYTGTLKAQVQRSASPPVIIVQKIIHTGSNAFKSSFGLWLSLLIALPIIFILVVVSPIAALAGGVIALIPAFYFGSINIGIIGGIAVLAGIVAHFLKRIG